MARNDAYLPSPVNVASGGGEAIFDGSAAATNTAIVSGLQGNIEVEIYYEGYDGSSWQTLAQLADDNGNDTFAPDWASQFNRLKVSTNDRRIRITNVDTSGGYVAIDGVEL